MDRSAVRSIVRYYKYIPDMLKSFREQREEIEDRYYGGIRAVNNDGIPHVSSPGRPTEAAALRAEEDDAAARLREIEARIVVLEADYANIRECLDALNDKYRRLIIMRLVNDYSWTRMSHKFELPESTVRYVHGRALDRLGEALEELPMCDELERRASRAR